MAKMEMAKMANEVAGKTTQAQYWVISPHECARAQPDFPKTLSVAHRSDEEKLVINEINNNNN